MLRLKELVKLLADFDKRNNTDSDLEFYDGMIVHRIKSKESRCITPVNICEYLKNGIL